MKAQDLERFMAKVDMGGECWVWTAGRWSNDQYGCFWLDGRMQAAHRVSFEHNVRPLADHETIDHLCRNTLCVRPLHMEPVSLEENVRRGEGCCVQNARKSHCNRGHELSGDNLILYRGFRYCRQCKNINNRAYRARQAIA